MENIILFVLTTVTYLGVWCFLKRPKCLAAYAKRATLLALLCVPININENIFTVMGNTVSEKNSFSIVSLYQKAALDAKTIIGLSGYQSAGRDAVTGIGLSGYQSAGRNAVTIIGLSGYQSAGRDAVTVIGLTIYQKVEGKTRSFGAFTPLIGAKK